MSDTNPTPVAAVAEVAAVAQAESMDVEATAAPATQPTVQAVPTAVAIPSSEAAAAASSLVVVNAIATDAVPADGTDRPIVAAEPLDPNAPVSKAKMRRPSRQGKLVPRWTSEEEEKLLACIGDGDPRGRWPEIATELGSGRSHMSVEQHWYARAHVHAPASAFLSSCYRALATAAHIVCCRGDHRIISSHSVPPLISPSCLPCDRQIMMGKRKKHQSVKQPKPEGASNAAESAGAEGGTTPKSAAKSDAEGAGEEGGEDGESGGKVKRTRTRGGTTPRWSEAEEAQLLALRNELGERSWKEIAERLGTNRSASGVEQHWQIMAGKRRRSTPSSGGGGAEPASDGAVTTLVGMGGDATVTGAIAVASVGEAAEGSVVAEAVAVAEAPMTTAAAEEKGDAPAPAPATPPLSAEPVDAAGGNEDLSL